MQERFPEMRIIWCPEAVDGNVYQKGKLLKDRTIDLLEFGRSNEKVLQTGALSYQAMGDAIVTIALPRSMTQPEMAGDIETLTQRYWECMFSRMVMVGHAPKELVDFIGYNPVIELKEDISAEALIQDVLEHIDDYQSLVDKNRKTAQRLGSWDVRMKWLMEELRDEYEV